MKKKLLRSILAITLSITLMACSAKADTPSGLPASGTENSVTTEKSDTNSSTKPESTENGASGQARENTSSDIQGSDTGNTGSGQENTNSGTTDPDRENTSSDTPDQEKSDITQDEIDKKLADWKPDFTFSTSDFDLFNWDDTCFAQAKLTMINLWAYWCGPCLSELPEINRLSEEYADKGVMIFGLTYPEEESLNREVVDEFGLTYQMLLYTDDFDRYMDSGFLPTTIFVDSNGHVIGEPVIGARSYEDWKAMIDEYLK